MRCLLGNGMDVGFPSVIGQYRKAKFCGNF